jgi:hypothetical protein
MGLASICHARDCMSIESKVPTTRALIEILARVSNQDVENMPVASQIKLLSLPAIYSRNRPGMRPDGLDSSSHNSPMMCRERSRFIDHNFSTLCVSKMLHGRPSFPYARVRKGGSACLLM